MIKENKEKNIKFRYESFATKYVAAFLNYLKWRNFGAEKIWRNWGKMAKNAKLNPRQIFQNCRAPI